MTTILEIKALPCSPYDGSDFVGIVITSGVPSYFSITGTNLDQIKSIDWYPENPTSVQFEKRNIILVNNTLATFMIKVIDNYLNDSDRGGILSFRLLNGQTLYRSVKTYGPVSAGPLWTSPTAGLITG